MIYLKRAVLLLWVVNIFLGGEPMIEGKREILITKDRVIPGHHCESSAILNAAIYMGYPINESMIIGAGGAPSFVFSPTPFPFLGGRSLEMKERFFEASRIKWSRCESATATCSLDRIEKLLDRGVPVVCRVDMRFLPYLYGGKYGPPYMSFGYHFITVFGIDRKKNIAWVSDTSNKTLQPLSLNDLRKARFSTTKHHPPEGRYYWVDRAPVGFRIDWNRLVRYGLEGVIRNMTQINIPGVGISGLKKFVEQLKSIDNMVPMPQMLPAVLNGFHGWIELYGTGGAAFRSQFIQFLREADKKQTAFRLIPLIAAVRKSEIQWKRFASACKQLSSEILNISAPDQRKNHYSKLSEIAHTILICEKEMIDEMKALIRTSIAVQQKK